MLIGGLQKLTLVDYPGKVAAAVFTVGCNFFCPFCHNPELVDIFKMKKQILISEEDFFQFLKSRQGDLDGVCVSGGEPTLQKDLPEFLREIKELGFSVKLDTNGTNPEMLKALIQSELVDYVAMDIKASAEKYHILSNRNLDVENIKQSVRLIKNMENYEFRTTVIPKYHDVEDLLAIAEWIRGSKKYFLQQFRPVKTLDLSFMREPAYSSAQLQEFCQILKPYFQYCSVRT